MAPPRPGSAGLAEWSGTRFRLLAGKDPGSNPGAAISVQPRLADLGEQPEVDRGRIEFDPAAGGVFCSHSAVTVQSQCSHSAVTVKKINRSGYIKKRSILLVNH